MAVVGEAILELQGDDSSLTKSFRRAQGTVAGFGGSLKSAATTVSIFSAAIEGLATGALVLGARKMFDYGSAVEETASKFRTALGPETKRAQEFLDDFARTAGLTNREGRDLLATTAGIAQGMGLASGASADLAEQVTRLAGDLASYNNIPIAETSRAVIGGITGERESLKRLGIVLLESEVQKRALADTGKKNVEQLTQEEKALAALALMYQKAGVQVGDLARTKDSAANRARALAARFKDIRDQIAAALLPALVVVMEQFEQLAGAAGVGGLTDALTRNSSRIAAWTAFTIESVKAVANAFGVLGRVVFNTFQIMAESAVFSFKVITGQWIDAFRVARSSVENLKDIANATDPLVASFDKLLLAAAAAFRTMEDGPKNITPGPLALPSIGIPEGGGGGADELSDKIKEIADDLQGAIRTAGLMESTLADAFDLPREGASAYGRAVEALAAENVDLDRVVTAQGQTFRDLVGVYQELEQSITRAESAERALSIRREQKNALDKEARGLLQGLRTESDLLNASVERANFLHAAGFLADTEWAFAVRRLGEEFTEARTKTDALNAALEDIALSGFAAIGDAAFTAGQSITSFVSNAIRDLARLAAKLLIVKALMSLFPGSGFVGGLAAAVGLKGRAGGGTVHAGHAYRVNEQNRVEAFVPAMDGQIVPANAMGGSTGVTLDFSRFPAAANPFAAARDGDWQQYLAESLQVAFDNGFRPRNQP